jgi:hypothetical protein
VTARNLGTRSPAAWYCPGCSRTPGTRHARRPSREVCCPLCCGYTDPVTANRNRRVHELDVARQRAARRNIRETA